MSSVRNQRVAVAVGVGGVLLLAAIVVWVAVVWLAPFEPGTTPSEPPVLSPSGTPTSEASVAPSPEPTPDPGAGLATATMEVVFAGWIPENGVLEVSGFTASVVESGGTCTLSAQGPGGLIEVSREAFEDRTVTTCGTLDILGEELTNGEYDVTLSYRSETHEGTSAITKVQVAK